MRLQLRCRLASVERALAVELEPPHVIEVADPNGGSPLYAAANASAHAKFVAGTAGELALGRSRSAETKE